MKKLHLILFLLGLLFSLSTQAQYGYSNASYAHGRMMSDQLFVPKPEQVIVEEYINYHRHNIPLPAGGESVKMDLRWSNNELSSTNEAILQIGFATSKKESISDAAPLNLCLVIDKSGSMNGDRIKNAREACKKLVERLRPTDIISIVVFNQEASILFSAKKMDNDKSIYQVIESIYADGSTDLNSGLILGYKEVMKNYNSKFTNKVIMLTDALTNTGTVDPELIVKNSNAYHKENAISFTIVGVGVDFNEGLSRQLSTSQKNSIHFINDGEDIQKVFVDEIESLLSPVARNVELEINYDGLVVDKVYGYQPFYHDGKILFNLDNMNSGLTQVVLIKFKVNGEARKTFSVNAKLWFTDIKNQKNIILDQSIVLRTDKRSDEMFKDNEVKKNYYIALMAEGMKDMAKFYHEQKLTEAKNSINTTLDMVRKQYGDVPNDADVKRLFDILSKYESGMRKLDEQNEVKMKY